MWCTHTPKPRNATRISASATSGKNTIRRCTNVGMIDVAIPNAGRMMMYTSGCPKIQNRFCHSSGVTSERGVVEVKAELAVELQEQRRHAQRRQREQQRERHRQKREAEQRHPVDRHARRAQLEDRDDEVDRRDRARDPVEDQPVAVEVDVVAGIELLGGQRHVVKPAGVGSVALQQRRVHEQPGAQVDPERQRVQPRKGHVTRPDHQRDQVVPERARGHRDHEQEDHRDPVHREHLVVGLGREQVPVGADQLGADEQRLHPAGAEEAPAR